MRHSFLCLFNILFFSNLFVAQTDSAFNYHAPLEIPLILSANFGELRPNHFHMGIDFKTKGVEGQKLLAIEKGYVSRIKVSPSGYGKVIYINHPNGVTSVYAHCSVFLGAIDSLVKLTQERNKNYEIEIFPSSSEIILEKGENFALSGNTGSSTAPHLHFELRDTKTETALNPLKFGFDIVDEVAPQINGLKIYSVSERGYRMKGKSKNIAVKKGQFGYYIGGNAAIISSDFCTEQGGIGLAFEVTDHYSQATNPIGIYGSYLVVNKDTVFGHKIDSISFESTRYINSHIDYEENSINKKKYQKSFRTKENNLSFYNHSDLGIIFISPNDSSEITYGAYDTKNNKSELKFKLKVLPGPLHSPVIYKKEDYLLPEKSYSQKSELCIINIPEGCLYEPAPKKIQVTPVLSVANASTPIQLPIQIKLPLKTNTVPIEKYYIAGNSTYLPTKFSDGWLSTECKVLGTFSVKYDTVAPLIVPLNFSTKDSICKKKLLTWKITESKTAIADYDLFIDGKWYLLEFESKGSYAYFHVPPALKDKHSLKIITKDVCGNESIWEKEIYFQL
jgi:hypothetical protein